MPEIARSHLWARRISIVSTAVLVILLAAWVRTDPRVNLETDWTSFDNAAERLFAGEPVYVPWSVDEPLPYLYPPFVLILAAPLGLLGFYGSWVFSAFFTLSTFLGGIWLLSKTVSGTHVARTTGLIVATFSGSVVAAALVGQYSGLYVLAFGLAAWLWHHDRQLLAGVALAFLVMKPNIALVVPVALVWARSWRALGGFGLGTVGAFGLSVPFGLDRWSGFVSNVQQMGELQRADAVFPEKMVTIVGSLQETFDLSSTSLVTLSLWLGSCAIVGVATLVVWTRAEVERQPVRAFGVLAVFAVIANPRMYFYDGTLVIFGFLAIWLTLDSWGGGLARRWIPRLCAALWFFSWGGVFASLNAFVGPLAAVGLVVVAVDTCQQRAVRSEFDSNLDDHGDVNAACSQALGVPAATTALPSSFHEAA